MQRRSLVAVTKLGSHARLFFFRSPFSCFPLTFDMLRTLGKRTIAVSKCFNKPRSLITSRPASKTVSKLNLSELVLETETSTPLKPLELKEISTGSVVLDTVREYTKKYPLCVLLVQVGDFYEVRQSTMHM